MSALSTISTPAAHGRRSTANPVQDTQAAAVKQPAAATTVDATTVTSTEPGTFRKMAGKAAKVIGAGMLILGALVFLFLAIGPRILGYQTSTMLTGSMAPLINPGDVVVTIPTPVTDIKVGDVITYHIPVEDQRVETHRITDITTTAEGGIAVQTKGDANNGIDPWIATLQGTTVDKQIATIPHIGNAIRTLREPMVMNTLMYGAPAILIIGMLASIWTKDPNKTTPEDIAGVGDEAAA